MSRLFTVNFSFKNQNCTALVNIKEEGYDMHFHIRYLDKEIANLVPDGRVDISLASGVAHSYILSNVITSELVQTTSEAISNHLNMVLSI
jgi:hypothetical protein